MEACHSFVTMNAIPFSKPLSIELEYEGKKYKRYVLTIISTQRYSCQGNENTPEECYFEFPLERKSDV